MATDSFMKMWVDALITGCALSADERNASPAHAFRYYIDEHMAPGRLPMSCADLVDIALDEIPDLDEPFVIDSRRTRVRGR